MSDLPETAEGSEGLDDGLSSVSTRSFASVDRFNDVMTGALGAVIIVQYRRKLQERLNNLRKERSS
jgi:hypothetical protein